MMGAADIRSNIKKDGKKASGEFNNEIERLNRERREKRRSYMEATHGSLVASRENPDAVGAALAAACASGDEPAVRRILEANREMAHTLGADGTSPLCAAAMWGHTEVLKLLLSAGADPRQRNRTQPQWTALHAAALQEQGKACMLLLEKGADPLAQDALGVTPADYASISEAVFPIFAARGVSRTRKDELIAKGIIRKVSEATERQLEALPADDGRRGLIPEISRPGSAYVVTREHPPRPESSMGARPASKMSARGRPIDILEEEGPQDCINTERGLRGLNI